MRTPAVRILLLILIGENRLERSPVQVELHHIGRGERARRQGRVEQLVDHLATRCADLRRGLGRRMRSDDDPCAWSCWGQQEIRAVKERATGSRGADGSSAGQVARPDGPGPEVNQGDRSPCLASRSPVQPNLRQGLPCHIGHPDAPQPG